MGLEGSRPQSKEKTESKRGEIPEQTRRSFLRGLSALAASTVVSSETFAGVVEQKLTPKQEKLNSLINKISFAQNKMRAPDVQKALECKHPYDFEKVLTAAEMTIDPLELEGTMYDVSELHRRALQIVYPREMETTLLPNQEKSFLTANESGYSNGVAIAADMVLTARHTHDGMEHKKLMQPAHRDIGLVRLTKVMVRQESVVQIEPEVTNKDIAGSLVVIVGIDPDATANKKTGRKTWIGIGIDLSRGLHSAPQFKKSPNKKPLQASFGVILPAGETRLPPKVNDVQPPQPAAGMSGSAMYAWVRGKWRFAGIFWAADTVDNLQKKTCWDLGLVHGIDDVKEGLKTAPIKTI